MSIMTAKSWFYSGLFETLEMLTIAGFPPSFI